MRRYREARPSGLFRGSELARLMTMVIMLAVLVMLMTRAKDPRTWRWIAADDNRQDDAPPAVATPQPSAPAPAAAPAPPKGPTDLDPEEKEAAEEEFQAVTDKVPLRKEEMPAYWRLMRWQKNETLSDMRKRARKDVFYPQFWARPDQYRGQLIRLDLHLKRVLHYEEKDKPGFEHIYEAWGWSADSQPNSYVVVLSDLPKGMPQGLDVVEDAVVYGYFFKLLGYEEAHDGKTRAAPLLIGKAVWQTVATPEPGAGDWVWTWGIGGLLLILFLVRWGSAWMPRRSPVAWSRLGTAPPAHGESVEGWLDGSNHAEPWDDHSNSEPAGGNGKPHEHSRGEPIDE